MGQLGVAQLSPPIPTLPKGCDGKGREANQLLIKSVADAKKRGEMGGGGRSKGREHVLIYLTKHQ